MSQMMKFMMNMDRQNFQYNSQLRKRLKLNNLKLLLLSLIQRSHLQHLYFKTRRIKMNSTFLMKSTIPQFFLILFRATKVKCPFCDAVSISIVEYRPSLIGYLLTMLALLIFGVMSLVLLPLLVSLTKTAIHRCAKCLNEVKTNSYFGFNSMEDKLVTFSVGNVGVILTRRLILYMVLVVTAVLAIYGFIVVESSHNHDVGESIISLIPFNLAPISEISWKAFSLDVGHSAWMKNPR